MIKILDLQRVQTVVKNKPLKCFEYTVYKQSSCKLGHESSGDLYLCAFNLDLNTQSK